MKLLNKYGFFALLLVFAFAACEKAPEVVNYKNGTAVTLTASAPSVVLVAADTGLVKLTLTSTNPEFDTDTANYKYLFELDSTNTFANAKQYIVNGKNGVKGITGFELNNILISWGVPFGTARDVYFRVKASYTNNNDMQVSNVVKVPVTPTALPFTYTASSYGTFSPTVLTKDQVVSTLSWIKPSYGTFSLKYELQYDSSGKNFSNPKLYPVGTDLNTFNLTNLIVNNFAQNCGIANGATGAVDARVKVTVVGTNQVSYSGLKTFTIKPASMVLYLYVPGDYQKFAPYAASLPAGNNWGWEPSLAPKLASTDGINYDGYVYVPAGGNGEFKFTSQPDWNGTNYGSAGSGLLNAGGGGNVVWPTGATYFRVQVNTATLTWSATPITTWGLIGDGTPGGWNTSTPLTFNTTTLKWTGTATFTSGSFKFRANNGWDINLGGNTSQMTYGGDNIPVSATGSKNVTLDLTNPPYYTFTIN